MSEGQAEVSRWQAGAALKSAGDPLLACMLPHSPPTHLHQTAAWRGRGT